jgi:hypothetical protein
VSDDIQSPYVTNCLECGFAQAEVAIESVPGIDPTTGERFILYYLDCDCGASEIRMVVLR